MRGSGQQPLWLVEPFEEGSHTSLLHVQRACTQAPSSVRRGVSQLPFQPVSRLELAVVSRGGAWVGRP